MEAYPLHWPHGYKRTQYRIRSRFEQTMDKAQRFMRDEITRIGGKDLIVSTNIPVRKDGGLYADWVNKKIDDPGVAIYFKYKGKNISMCCDQYERIWENIYALGKGIEALRGMERWGVSDFLERAFTGFTALPEAAAEQTPEEILGVTRSASYSEIHKAYLAKAKEMHPDAGGSVEEFQKLKNAYDKLMKPAL
jgi:hypothetical protein